MSIGAETSRIFSAGSCSPSVRRSSGTYTLKTGTPPRLDRASIDFARRASDGTFRVERGDASYLSFARRTYGVFAAAIVAASAVLPSLNW